MKELEMAVRRREFAGMVRKIVVAGLVALAATHVGAQTAGTRAAVPEQDQQWPTNGGDPGGRRFANLAQITRGNVQQLKPAWVFHTGNRREGNFESTPILFHGSLYVTSPFDKVFAIDPATGTQRWAYEPKLDETRFLGVLTSRGVAAWSSSEKAETGVCSSRIFVGTLDGRLIALDAATGELCRDFGNGGSVDLTVGVEYRKGDDYSVTSPPTVVGDVVAVGSGIEDNLRVDVERGDVRGFDVRTGKLVWTFAPIPWADRQRVRTGAANVWAVMSADTEHGLLYLPVSSASPDYYGGLRPGDGRDADSIVALDARTGKKVWAYQIVHHDLWDYDLAAEPLLFTFRGKVAAVAVSTKMGMVFVFNRLTGEPLWPITERPVPQSDVPGEVTSPTQPFPALPAMSPLTLDLTKQLGATPDEDAKCRVLLAGRRYDGIYTPPSLKGTILFPSNVGGINWGSAALDPATNVLYANTNREPYFIRLQRRPLLNPAHARQTLVVAFFLVILLLLLGLFRLGGWRAAMVALIVIAVALHYRRYGHQVELALLDSPFLKEGGSFVPHFGMEIGQNKGVNYILYRQPITVNDHPCGPMPWGAVSALNLDTGQTTWQTPLGTNVPGMQTGTLSVGGPLVTAGGLVFTAASNEPYFHAYDSASGRELWTTQLPAAGESTPMSYEVGGKQYVVVAAGGHVGLSTGFSDSLIAYTLP